MQRQPQLHYVAKACVLVFQLLLAFTKKAIIGSQLYWRRSAHAGSATTEMQAQPHRDAEGKVVGHLAGFSQGDLGAQFTAFWIQDPQMIVLLLHS